MKGENVTEKCIPIFKHWEDELDSFNPHHITFQGFTPERKQRLCVFDTIEEIGDHSPSDANLVLTITKKDDGLFATLSIHSIKGHYFAQNSSNSIYELMEKIKNEALLQVKRKQFINFRTLFSKPEPKKRSIKVGSPIHSAANEPRIA